MSSVITFHMSDGEQIRWSPSQFLDRDKLMESIGLQNTRFIAVNAHPNGPGPSRVRMLNVDHIVSVDP